MEEQKTIKNVKELGDFIIAMTNGVLKARSDGKIDAADLQYLITVFPTIAPAFEGIGEIPGELKDLSDAEALELVTHVMAGLSVDEPKARVAIEKGFKFIVAGYELFLAVKGLKA